MYPFSCVLWAIFWSFSLLAIFLITEAKMPQKLIPNQRTINSKQLLKILIVQPHRLQIPAPYGKVVGGVDFLADADTSLYQQILYLIFFLC